MRFNALFLAVAFVLPVFTSPAPLLNHYNLTELLKDRYVVKLKPGVHISSVCNKTIHEYKIINGFSAKLNKTEVVALRKHAGVEYLALDVLAQGTAVETQHDAPWNLARLNTGERPLEDQNPDNLNYTFAFDSSGGEGVDIYVLDTGVYLEHLDFGGRARWGATFVPSDDNDVNGHGTHCAGTAGGSRFGAAKRASIIAVKVLDDNNSGTASGVVAGMDWVWRNFVATGFRPSIVSMSLGMPSYPPVDNAVAALTALGIHVVAAAGNDGVDASFTSPARAPSAVTVGGTDITDSRDSASNFGCLVDIFAPGVDVISTGVGCPDGYVSKSGTSMAAPHVAGVIATLISSDGNLSPQDMKAKLQQIAVEGVLSNIPIGTPNLLLQNGIPFRKSHL